MWTDRQITEAFVKMYGGATGLPYRITSWQDDAPSNQNVESVDGLAEAPGVPPLAIEVTKIESFSEQRLDDHQTEALAAAITPELAAGFPKGVTVCPDAGAWRKGIDWVATRGRITGYLRDFVQPLRPGMSRHDIPGVPFTIRIEYQPELNLPLQVGRIAPSESAKKEALLRSMEKALRHKAGRLREHRKQGARSVLVIESHDLALISHVHVQAVFVARKKIDGAHLDEVWFCRTANPHHLTEWYGLHGSQNVLDRVNLPNLRLGPVHDGYWEKAISEGRI